MYQEVRYVQKIPEEKVEKVPCSLITLIGHFSKEKIR
jgi:hypothetical protein